MTDTFFEIGFEGTSVEDCIKINKIILENKSEKEFSKNDNKIIVYEKQKEYGTTYRNIEDIKNNKMVKNFYIRKKRSNIILEIDPFFLRQTDEIINLIEKSGTSGFCEFIYINYHYLILEDGKYFKIPYSKSELVDTPFFTFKDRHLVNRFVKGEINLENLKNKLSDRCKQILLNGLIGNDINYEDKILEYLHNFEGYPFLYPKHGSKDISELLSRSNAINGTSYILDKNLCIYSFKEINKNINNENKINGNKINGNKINGNKINKNINTKNINNKNINNENKINENKINGNTIIKDKLEICYCNDDCDILDRFNTRNSSDDSSEEFIDIENDHTGQLYEKERKCCYEKNENKNHFLTCHKKEIYEKKLNWLITNDLKLDSKPIFFNNKIMIEDITNHKFYNEFSNKNILDISLESYMENLQNDYKYLIKSEHGNIFVKKIYKKEYTGIKKYIRILNISEKILADRFFAWMYNGLEFVNILMIDSNSKCCKEGTYIIYLIKNEKEITERDLEILNIHDCDILFDISFELWNYEHVIYS